METPRYRVISKEPIGLLSQIHFPGDEIDFVAWPTNDLMPINEAAKQISAYESKTRFDAFRPTTPFNAIIGGIFLPATTDPRSQARIIKNPPKNAPRYRARVDVILANVVVKEGSVVSFFKWPDELEFEPANDVAKRIAEYYEANNRNVHLLASPWCLFQNKLVLPDLPGSSAASLGDRVRTEPLAEIRKRPERQPFGSSGATWVP